MDSRILAQAPNDEPRELPDGFQPGSRDVICSRGADCYNHAGNQFFRLQLEENLEAYSSASSKLAKGLIVSEVIEKVREQGGSFVRQDPRTGRWFEVGDRLAREKTGQAMRSTLRKSCSSSRTCVRKSSSPVSRTAEPKSLTHAKPHPQNMFADELHKADNRLRGTASQGSLVEDSGSFYSSNLERPVSLPTSFSNTFGTTAMCQLQSSHTWSGVAADHGVAAPRLRRAFTDPSQLLDVAQTMVPPPPALNRDASTWSTNIARLPGLLDYDPYSAAVPPSSLRRMSSDFLSLQGIPFEIEINHEGEEGESESN